MRSRSRTDCFTSALLFLLAGLGAAFSPALFAAERDNLKPNGEGWQVFPTDIRSVEMLADGRALFVSDRFVEWNMAKPQVESIGELDIPWLQGVELHGTDNDGRLWLSDSDTPNVLRAWNPAEKTWLEHHAGKDGEASFRGPVFQSAAGRVYVPDLNGVHVLEPGKADAWSYQALHELNHKRERFYSREKSFNPPALVQDGAGRVYLHSRWGRFGWTGTVGYWVHETRAGKADKEKEADGWQQVTNHGEFGLERLLGIMPLGNGSQFLVCPESADAFWVDLFPPDPDQAFLDQIQQLDAKEFKDREKATRYLSLNGRFHQAYLSKVHAEIESPEIRMRLVRVLKNCGLENIDGRLLRHVTPLHPVVGEGAGQGGWWLHADQARKAEEKAEANSTGGIYHLSVKGELTKVSEPVGYPDAVCLGPSGELYLGTRLGVLLRCSVRAAEPDKEGAVVDKEKAAVKEEAAPPPAAKIDVQELDLPPHWRVRELFGVDKTGRLFLKGRRGLAALQVLGEPAKPDRVE